MKNKKKFSDVKEDFWATNEIENLILSGIINGYDDGTFKPNKSLNRGQAAELLTNALDLEITSNLTEAPFKDLTLNSYHAPFAAAVKAEGIITGKANGTFGASDTLTREQMATILVRAFNLEDTGENVTVSDWNSISETHKANVKILVQHGITNVTEYRPSEAVSRAQFAVFLYRALDKE